MNLGKLTELMIGSHPQKVEELKDYFEQIDKLINPAIEQFTKKKIESIIKMKYEAGTLGEKWVNIKEYEDECKADLKEGIAKKHNNGYVFITINPKPDVSLGDFREKVEKFCERNMFTEYRYVLEQRSETEADMGKGFHAHILLKRNLDYKPYKIGVNTKNTFKTLAKVDNPQILNIQHIGADFAKDKDEYMTGVKTGENKDKKQAIDVLWRKENNIESVYGDQFTF